ncbi:YfbM family protein [Flavobacterium sp. MMLR14_040]|uniref:YfbM family protein n=1 Tax=Flavobacterium sp. MMLR14_040 TaxID=3093843 RepID=UPI00298FBABA|nr:YfbM family protein [Flavobacterium sp. MMLR14_040]MDW8849975.1 YfbM family protein [Flavobacterium sp. MMLR14_040]
MGMIANLLRVTTTELETYLQDSSLLEERIYDENTTEDRNLNDVDKAWDGIIFLLTGQNIQNADHPLVQVLFSGQLIDEEQDLGYGPGHYLTPDQVKDLSDQISKITTEDLKKKYNSKKMNELDVYPIWDEDSFDYLAENFKLLQQIYAEAANNDQAIITFLN